MLGSRLASYVQAQLGVITKEAAVRIPNRLAASVDTVEAPSIEFADETMEQSFTLEVLR